MVGSLRCPRSHCDPEGMLEKGVGSAGWCPGVQSHLPPGPAVWQSWWVPLTSLPTPSPGALRCQATRTSCSGGEAGPLSWRSPVCSQGSNRTGAQGVRLQSLDTWLLCHQRRAGGPGASAAPGRVTEAL